VSTGPIFKPEKVRHKSGYVWITVVWAGSSRVNAAGPSTFSFFLRRRSPSLLVTHTWKNPTQTFPLSRSILSPNLPDSGSVATRPGVSESALSPCTPPVVFDRPAGPAASQILDFEVGVGRGASRLV
jgi:hypothetical protein